MHSGRAERVGGWSGLGFAVLSAIWIVWTVLVDTPEVQSSGATIVRFYSDHGNRAPLFALTIVLMLAGFLLLWFVAALHSQLDRTPRDAPVYAHAALAAGIVLVALTFVKAAADETVINDAGATNEFRVNADTVRVIEGFTVWIGVAGAFSGATLLLAASLAARDSDWLPRWLVRSGLTIGVVNLVGAIPFHGVTLILLPPWALAVGLVLLRQASSSPAAVEARPAH